MDVMDDMIIEKQKFDISVIDFRSEFRRGIAYFDGRLQSLSGSVS